MTKILTNSSMQCFHTCKRKYYYAYVMGLRKAETVAVLRFGSAIHYGIELHLNGASDEEVCDKLRTKYIDDKPNDLGDEQSYQYDCEAGKALAVMYRYLIHWRQIDATYEVIDIEQAFSMPLALTGKTRYMSRGLTLKGKIDGRVYLPGDFAAKKRLAIMEHKTYTGDIDDVFYWQRLTIDNQISLYWDATLADKMQPDTVLYNVIRKPNLRPSLIAELDDEGLKQVVSIETGERIQNKNGSWKQSVGDKETQKLLTRPETPVEFGGRCNAAIAAEPEKYFQRREIPRLISDLEEARYDRWQTAQLIHQCSKTGRWPRNTGACMQFNRPCQLFNVCTNHGTQNIIEIPDGYIKVDDPHQELLEEPDNADDQSDVQNQASHHWG